MLRKNLLYTAITRSKQSLILCGEIDAFMQGISTLDSNMRYTTLKERLEIKISTEDTSETTDHDLDDGQTNITDKEL